MRVVKEIPNDQCKISVFSWNDKYLIKFEMATLEQTYKVKQWDLTDESELDDIISDKFIEKVMNRFNEMRKDFSQTLDENTY